MSDVAIESDIEEEQEDLDESEPARRRLSGKVLVLYIVLPLLVVLGGTGVYLMQPGSPVIGGGEEPLETQTVFYDLPEILVNLSQEGKHQQFLKLKVSLELTDRRAMKALQPVMPRILDTFQIYLRELRNDDLEGSAGVYRLKEELLRRINLAIHPIKIDRVLFKEIIVQ